MKNFSDEYVLITGATSGIGQSIARNLAQQQANLCILGRNSDKLDALAGELTQFDSIQVEKLILDLSAQMDLNHLETFVADKFSKLSILIHSAGVIMPAEVKDLKPKDVEYQMNVNFTAPVFITQKLLPILEQNKGQIVFLNSSAIQRPIIGLGAYSASKLALKAFVDVLRQEVNPRQIRVISIYPGQVATPMQEFLYKSKNQSYRPQNLLQACDVASTVINALQMPDTAEITDCYIRGMKG